MYALVFLAVSFPLPFLYAFLFSPIRARRRAHLILHYFSVPLQGDPFRFVPYGAGQSTHIQFCSSLEPQGRRRCTSQTAPRVVCQGQQCM
jgi:hypothetical protein